MKALEKEKVLDYDSMDEVMTERNVLALGSSFPYLTHLHWTFTTLYVNLNIAPQNVLWLDNE